MFLKVVQDVLQTFVAVYKEFSVESTIHGFKYTTTAKTKLERFIWVIILLLSFLAAGQLASLFYERQQSASISTLVISNQYPTSMLELPALTLCHDGLAMTHKVVPYLTSQKRIYMPHGLTRVDFENSIKYLQEVVYPRNLYPDELDRLQQILTANQISVAELLKNINPNCSEFLLMCQFEGQTVPCSKLFEPIITHYGTCCVFNFEYSYSQRSAEILKVHYSAEVGLNFILSILMKSYPPEDRIASIIFGNSVKVFVHERHTYPSSKLGSFLISEGYETVVQLVGTRLISTSEVLDISTRVRGCSMNTKQGIYRSDNCLFKCYISVIKKLCGCIPMSPISSEYDDPACDLTNIPCLARARERTYPIIEHDPQCACLPDCESTKYKVVLATAPLDAPQYSPNSFYKEALRHQNVTALHLAFAGQTATLQQRELILSNINLLSSLGGVYGLFLGCSIISVIEILYFFCFFSIGKYKEIKAR